MVQIFLSITRVAPAPKNPPTGGGSGGTNLIGATNLSPVTKLLPVPGAVVSRRSEAESGVAVQTISKAVIYHGAGFKLRADALPVPTEPLASVRMSGCKNLYKAVLGAGAKVEDPPVAETKSRLGGAKSVTNNLPILSVLACVILFF
jgi:hypothetical protein